MRLYVCSLSATALRLYEFVPLVGRLRRGTEGCPRPWLDFWYSPNVNTPFFLKLAALATHLPPLGAVVSVSVTLGLF